MRRARPWHALTSPPSAERLRARPEPAEGHNQEDHHPERKDGHGAGVPGRADAEGVGGQQTAGRRGRHAAAASRGASRTALYAHAPPLTYARPTLQLSTQTEAETASKLSVLQAVAKKLNAALADSRAAAEAREARLHADLEQARHERAAAEKVRSLSFSAWRRALSRPLASFPLFTRGRSGRRRRRTASAARCAASGTSAARPRSSTTGSPASTRTLRSCRMRRCAARRQPPCGGGKPH